eukprot:3553808-Rhodomonas_salina.1
MLALANFKPSWLQRLCSQNQQLQNTVSQCDQKKPGAPGYTVTVLLLGTLHPGYPGIGGTRVRSDCTVEVPVDLYPGFHKYLLDLFPG